MKRYQVKTQFKEVLNPEEILLDTKQREVKDKGKLEISIKNQVFFIVFGIFIVFFLGVFYRTFYLTFYKGNELKENAVNNYLRVIYSEAPRGLVYTGDKKPLVKNIKSQTKTTKKNAKEKKYSRYYIDSQIFSPILGYTREAAEEELKQDLKYYEFGDWVGKDGIEKQYEKYLRGKKGIREKVVNAAGKILSDKVKKKPALGDKLILNIDYGLQKKIYNSIKKKAPNSDAVAVALNPQTGAVLSMVSIPSDDNNVFSKSVISTEELKYLQSQRKIFNINKAIRGFYPSGSIIKPLIAIAGLEEKIITAANSVLCQGSIKIPNPWNPQKPTVKKDWKTHGVTNLRKAIAESCNVYFYTLGAGYDGFKGLGIHLIKKYLDLFYIEKELGIDLPGERTGFVPTPEWFDKEQKKYSGREWSIADVYDVSIGQGFFSATPLHMASALAAITNGGKIMQPQVVDKIQNTKGKLIKDIEPKVLKKNFIDKESVALVKDGMRYCVTSSTGSCRQMDTLKVTSGGKTGTAESDDPKHNHAWFATFAPYENSKIFLLILIEYGGQGSDIAEPIAYEVLKWYFGKQK
jgi:penicillin-binding protein 2